MAVAARAGAGRTGGTFTTIYRVVARIPRGRVATYGQIARMAGFPGAARMVGWALGALPEERGAPDDVPWHRVINAAGAERHDMVDDISMAAAGGLAGSRAGVLAFKCAYRRRRSRNAAARIARHVSGCGK